MSTETSTTTSTHLGQPQPHTETRLGCNEYCDNWTRSDAAEYWPADYLYSRKGKHYQHLSEIDAGLKNGYTWWNQPYFTYLENRDLIEILAGNLRLTIRQRRQAVRYFLAQDLQRWGLRKELVAWATCAYIVHSDEVDPRRCHPLTKEEDSDDLFLEAAYSLDLRPKPRHQTYCKIESDYRLNWG